MRENHNPKEMLLAIEQWHKIETMLNELPLTREQRRIVGDVKWHAAKYNSSYSRIRNEDEQLWKTERHFVSLVLHRVARPPFLNSFPVYIERDGLIRVERMIVEGAFQSTKRKEAVFPDYGVKYLKKPKPTIKYRLQESIMYYHIESVVLLGYLDLIAQNAPESALIEFCREHGLSDDSLRIGPFA